jgi:class 3 adenylate cyclase/tetratricopeptide (TPR) repeat protein
MSFLDTIVRAKAFLEGQGRVSLRALQREFGLDDEALDELVEELVEVQLVAAREGKVLSWIGTGRTQASASQPETPEASSEPTASGQPAEAERRQLTVMFCDLVGSTNLSQRLDAEDLRYVVRAYQESASEVIERYEGNIAQYLGDGLLVYFGYPQAHEDDAERAVRAGREILTALGTLNERLEHEHGVRLAARVGIHTGPVVVGEMGGGAKRETLALGDTTNIAARLESVAEPDSVVISGATLRLVPGVFSTKDLGTPALKGIADPVRAYVVLKTTGVRGRLDVDPTKLTPLVGRSQELGLLVERWELVKESEGQTVLVSGEAGLGKSRLLQTFRERLAETPHRWLECRCSPYTQGSAFHPVVELIEQGLGFLTGDDPEKKLTRLEASVEAAGLSAPDVVPLLAPLLALPLPDQYPSLQFSPELQRKRTFEALVAWILRLADAQPLVLLVEDLHWCDASTVEFLGWLLEQSPAARVLWLLSFRPDFEPPWPARSHVTSLVVERLSRRDAANLIGGMTRDVPLPGAVVERLIERADGVPLFVEELTKMVLESDLVQEREGRYELTGPITHRAIPATLQDSLMARLDRLDEGKRVAQLGAALGREFFYELLRRVSLEEEPRLRTGLAQLVDAELLYQRGALPRAEFTFKHALIQEIAYQSLLRSVRQQLHARIAHVLEEQFPERALSEPEVVARHYDEAGLAEPAIAHYRRASQRSTERSAHAEAVASLSRAIELLATIAEDTERDRLEFRLQMGLGVALQISAGQGDPGVGRAYERALALSRRIGRGSETAQALSGLSMFCRNRDVPRAVHIGIELLRLAEEAGEPTQLLLAHVALGNPLYFRGEFVEALSHFERAVALYDASQHQTLEYEYGLDPGASSYALAANALWLLGYPARAVEQAELGIQAARAAEVPASLAFTLSWAACLHLCRGEPRHALELADEAVLIAGEAMLPMYSSFSLLVRTFALSRFAGASATVAAMADVEEVFRRRANDGAQPLLAFILCMLAETNRSLGRIDAAEKVVAAGKAHSKRRQVAFWDAELQRLEAELHLEQTGADEEVEGLYRRALEIAEGQRAMSLKLRVATSLARLYQRRGERNQAVEILRPVYEWFTEGFDTQDLKDAKALLDEPT